jgi:hypothetical protein
MARQYSLSDLRELVRARYDLDTFGTDTYVTTDVVDSFINESIQDLNAILIECYGSDYFLTTTSLSVNANDATTDLPLDCTKLRAMYWQRSTDDLPEIHKADAGKLHMAFRSAEAWTCPKYILTRRTITWLPTPSTAVTVKLVYVATQDDLADSEGDDGIWTAEPGWTEYIVADVCRKISEREDKDPSVWIAAREKWEAKIRSQAPDREDAEPSTIRDTWGNRRGMSAWELRDRLTLDEG